MYEIQPGRATIWLTDYRFNTPTVEEATRLAIIKAGQDVPEATTKIIRTRRTPKGTWVVTVKRDRTPVAVQTLALTPEVVDDLADALIRAIADLNEEAGSPGNYEAADMPNVAGRLRRWAELLATISAS